MTLHLQPRDLLILSELGDYGFLSSAVIHARHWTGATTARACQQRLMLLCKQGLLKRVHLLVAHQSPEKRGGVVGGSIPSAFALTPEGAEVLFEATGQSAKRVSKSKPADATLLHRLEMVEARLAIDDACRVARLSVPEWIYEYDPIPGIKVTLGDPPEERFILYERFQIGDQQPFCRPDASCRMQIPNASGTGFDTLIAYWELDRATNSPVVEREKTLGYKALLATKRYYKHWPALETGGGLAVRIFYVCPTQERIDSVINEVRSSDVSQQYRFAVRGALTATAGITERIWQGIDGRRYAIAKGSTAHA